MSNGFLSSRVVSLTRGSSTSHCGDSGSAFRFDQAIIDGRTTVFCKLIPARAIYKILGRHVIGFCSWVCENSAIVMARSKVAFVVKLRLSRVSYVGSWEGRVSGG